MDLRNRKRVILFVRIGLIAATIVFVFSWIVGRVSNQVQDKFRDVGVQTQAPTAKTLLPGDVQILTTDGTFDVTLSGDKILAGLSEATVAKVRDEIAKETDKQQTGLGAVIAGAVKSGVSSAIGMHITYALSDIREIRFDAGRLTVVTKDGSTHGLSGDSKSGGNKEKALFSEADAMRLIEAVKSRKNELGLP
ncbi:MAG: hypothetical protein AABZ80_12820 [Gemmatimonadota bacterium]